MAAVLEPTEPTIVEINVTGGMSLYTVDNPGEGGFTEVFNLPFNRVQINKHLGPAMAQRGKSSITGFNTGTASRTTKILSRFWPQLFQA